MILYRTSLNHFLLLRVGKHVVLTRVKDGEHEEIARVPWKEADLVLKAEAGWGVVSFWFGAGQADLQQIGPELSLGLLSDEEAWGFNGPYVGMYATSSGQASKTSAAFDWFEYQGR
jgi:alpha-N-arabinofuranosidase